MQDPLSILVLHSLPPKSFRFIGVEETEMIFQNFNESHNVHYHNFFINPSEKLRKHPFDVVVCTATFLSRISQSQNFKRLQKHYRFLKKNQAYKIGFPQDDYWCQDTRDLWYSQHLDHIVSVFDDKHWTKLYPKTLEKGIKISRGHTVYLSPKLIEYFTNYSDKPREIDVVYRTTGMPYYPNSYGIAKAQIGERFKITVRNRLNVDISNRVADLIYGKQWVKFLYSSKAVLGSNSGSSVIIRDHAHAADLKRYLNEHPELELDQVEQNFFKASDRDQDLTDISPRNIEAGLTRTLQVLYPGDYGGILKPGIHYFQLNSDFSNIEDLYQLLQSADQISKITDQCFNVLLQEETLNPEKLMARLFSDQSKFSKISGGKVFYYWPYFFQEKWFNFLFILKFYLKKYLRIRNFG